MKRLALILSFLLPLLAYGQDYVTTPADSLLAEEILASLKAQRQAAPAQLLQRGDGVVAGLMVSAGKALEGREYVAGTLDVPGGERLRIHLTQTDCILFVETCLALARTAAQDGGFDMFVEELRQSRYRDGQVTAYADRLHYTTEWGLQGIERGVLQDVTPSLGGVVRNHPVSYMSTHPDLYPLMDDVEAIRSAEKRINSVPSYYIPSKQISQALGGIRSGDIICFVTTVAGLDVSHVAMAVSDGSGPVRLLHASTGAMKVLTEPRTLPEYLAARPSVAGIRILRPLDPR